MAKIKKTKTELKFQRDSLHRFQRYLPTLELKKQQLRVEVNRLERAVEEKQSEIAHLKQQLDRWVGLFGEEFDYQALLEVTHVETALDNIAGVSIPVCRGVDFEQAEIDLFLTPPWLDDGIRVIRELVLLEMQRIYTEKARDLLAEELRITSQRVNLFEKVKIPESRENIRVIKISLGDAQTAGVARAKLAKSKVA